METVERIKEKRSWKGEVVKIKLKLEKKFFSMCFIFCRCKRCKSVCAGEAGIVGHCKQLHLIDDPKVHRDYNACTAADVMVSVIKKCFPALTDDSTPCLQQQQEQEQHQQQQQ